MLEAKYGELPTTPTVLTGGRHYYFRAPHDAEIRNCAGALGPISRGSFDSVKRIEQAIVRWLAHWNDNAKPFRWIEIVAQIKGSFQNSRLIYGTEPYRRAEDRNG